MHDNLSLKAIYAPTKDVVAREIEGELILVPLTSGIGDLEDALYTFNAPGRALWNKLDGVSTLEQIADKITREFDGTKAEIEADVVGLANELQVRGMIQHVDRV